MLKPGPRNLITDIAGLKVGNAEDHQLKSGTTVLVGDKPFVAAVNVMGGAPGTRDTDLLAPDKLVQEVDALVLSGGSVFGLDAPSGVTDGLRAMGRGFSMGGALLPVAPGAILFDITNGGDKSWQENPYRALGRRALEAAEVEFLLGTHGAGTGATTADMKGGLGSASLVLPGGLTVGALVGVNPVGSVTVAGGPHFWAAPFEFDGEFGNRGMATLHDPTLPPITKLNPSARTSTTIAIVATDAILTQAQATRMAIAAQDGMARAIVPSHTPFDGDLVFAVATGEKPLGDPVADPLLLGHAAGICLARAIARAVYLAEAAAQDKLPTWQQKFG